MVTQALQETCVPLEKWRPQQKRDPENNFSLSLNRMYNYDSETPGMIRAYERINAVKVRSYLLLKTNSKPEHLDFAKAYPDQVPTNTKKIGDIHKVLQYIQDIYRSFYDVIVAWKTTTNEDTEWY